jgi:hypothetical protein
MTRINVTLELNEREALFLLAEREKRDPRAQAALIIRRELERVGLLPTDPTPAELPAVEVVEYEP